MLEVFGGCTPDTTDRLRRLSSTSSWMAYSLITTAAEEVDAPPVVYMDSFECCCLCVLPVVPTDCVVFKNSFPFLPYSCSEIGS